jgi:broad specificity phosphatase PhoE
MASIYLIRHGQASFGTDDYDRLSTAGHRQAQLAGEYLAHAAPQVQIVLSGTLRRQRETAEGILEARRAAGLAVPVLEVDQRFNELDIEGQFTHLLPTMTDEGGELQRLQVEAKHSSRQYQKLLRRVFAHWQQAEAIAEIESWQSFESRVRMALEDVRKRALPGSNAVVVTSGGVIATIAHRILGLSREGAYPLFEALMNCSITQLLHDQERISLLSYNECSYLRVSERALGERGLMTFR